MKLFNFNMECVGDREYTDEQIATIKDELFNLMDKHDLTMVNLGVYDLVDSEGNSIDVPDFELPPDAQSVEPEDKTKAEAIMAAVSKALTDAGFEIIDANSSPESDTDYTYPQTSKRLN